MLGKGSNIELNPQALRLNFLIVVSGFPPLPQLSCLPFSSFYHLLADSPVTLTCILFLRISSLNLEVRMYEIVQCLPWERTFLRAWEIVLSHIPEKPMAQCRLGMWLSSGNPGFEP